MRRPTCHAGNRKDAQFCKKYGGRLEILCPACKKTNPPDSTFCEACGHALRVEKKAPPLNPLKALTPTPPADETLPSKSSLQGERKHVAVLFSNLSGYTAMSEKLEPEEVKEITSRIFEEVAAVVARYDGPIEKYIGRREGYPPLRTCRPRLTVTQPKHRERESSYEWPDKGGVICAR